MPPKKKASSSTKTGATPSTPSSHYLNHCLLLIAELGQLLDRQQAQQPPQTLEQTYGQVVEYLGQQLEELEKPLKQLQIVQQEEQKRKQKAESSSAVAAATSSTAPAVTHPTPSTTITNLPSQTHLDALSAWLRSEAPNCLIGEKWEFEPRHDGHDEGTGLRAVKKLEKEELFMNIPRSVMITSDGIALTSTVGSFLAKDALCKKIPSLLLACSLLYERALGSESYWQPYIVCLPHHFNLPQLWSHEQIQRRLQASPTIYEILSLRRTMIRQYVHVFSVLKNGGFLLGGSKAAVPFDLTWSDFQWAISVIMTRQNRIPPIGGEGEPSIALIPGFDFGNHRGFGEIATFFEPSTQESKSLTIEPVEAGHPIYLFYGSRNNAKLMTYCGFVDPNHQNDEMEFILTTNGQPACAATKSTSSAEVEDSFLKIKLMLLKKASMRSSFGTKLPLPEPIGLDSSASSSSSTSSDPESIAAAQEARQQARVRWNAMMHFLRVVCLNTKDHIALALKYKPTNFGNPLSPTFHFLPSLYEEHDLEAFTFLHDSLTATLQSYATTLEHDENELLKDDVRRETEEHDLSAATSSTTSLTPTLPHHHLHAAHRLAVELRRSEKKLLEQAIARALDWKNKESQRINKLSAQATEESEK